MPQPNRPDAHARHPIVPPYLLERIAVADHRFGVAAEAARRSLLRDVPRLEGRIDDGPPALHFERDGGTTADVEWPAALPDAPSRPDRQISDAVSTETLPGTLVRREGEHDTGDVAVDDAYDGLGDTHRMFVRAFGRDSIDGAGMTLEATVHFGHHYDNAFWDGERMVFGDGDGEVFRGFTHSLSVIGHELAHGVTERTAGLRYQGQSGALNEHLSDVFGALVEQYALGQDESAATWLIGAEVFSEEVQGIALRSMSDPGTAYDDDVLGLDPQPGHFDDFIVTTADNGGVHLNSGIPNRAFVLVARALGGFAWQRPGRIWYDAITSGRLTPDADFAAFAAETMHAAATRFGRGSTAHDAVRTAWHTVGVPVPGGAQSGTGD